MKELREAQNSTEMVFPRTRFHRLVRELTVALFPSASHPGSSDIRWTFDSVMAVQTAAEAYLTGLLWDTNLLAAHARRVTIMTDDMKVARIIRGESNEYPGRPDFPSTIR